MTTTEERLTNLETESTTNTVIQRQLAENIESLSKKVTKGFKKLDNRLDGVESAIRELTAEIRNGRS